VSHASWPNYRVTCQVTSNPAGARLQLLVLSRDERAPLPALLGVALGDGDAGGVPQGAGVVAVAVQLEHRVDDVLDAAAVVDDAAEVAQVLLARADAPGQVGRADALVPRDDDPGVEGGDGAQAGRGK
jgi:hypothetical protein